MIFTGYAFLYWCFVLSLFNVMFAAILALAFNEISGVKYAALLIKLQEWPLWLRRLYLLTFPISFPIRYLVVLPAIVYPVAIYAVFVHIFRQVRKVWG